MKSGCAHVRGCGGSAASMASMSAVRKHCCSESNASPESSDWMRSGRSAMTALRRSWRAEDCQDGTRWSMCLHVAAVPASLQASHASVTCSCAKTGRPVIGSLILNRRV